MLGHIDYRHARAHTHTHTHTHTHMYTHALRIIVEKYVPKTGVACFFGIPTCSMLEAEVNWGVSGSFSSAPVD